SLTTARIVLLSTHIVGDVEAVASRLAIMRDGQIVADTTPQEVMKRAMGQVWEFTVDLATVQRLQTAYRVTTMISKPTGVYLRLISPKRPLETATPADPTLEEAVLVANTPVP
ncbi:MAG TPA: ABC transporter ATP-binding protein, partial [Ktedonobacterales bacterium]|nr:ABC transporter ATP-binding protein [Ktedonobacterales bacterium]